jgi:hypothetical protein
MAGDLSGYGGVKNGNSARNQSTGDLGAERGASEPGAAPETMLFCRATEQN